MGKNHFFSFFFNQNLLIFFFLKKKMLKKILHVGGGDDDKDAAPKASSTHKETLTVKGEFISYIIGAGGAQIKEIRDKADSDVKIDIPKGKAPQDDVTITITGSEKSHVSKAKKEIEHVVKHRNKDLKKDTKLHDKAYSDVDKHAEKRNKYYEESKAAFAAGDKEKAKKLSELGKKEQEKMDAAKEKAGAKVAKKKNKDSEPNEIDLHGLQVSEALKAVEK